MNRLPSLTPLRAVAIAALSRLSDAVACYVGRIGDLPRGVFKNRFKVIPSVSDKNIMEIFYLIAAFVVGGLAGLFLEYLRYKTPF